MEDQQKQIDLLEKRIKDLEEIEDEEWDDWNPPALQGVPTPIIQEGGDIVVVGIAARERALRFIERAMEPFGPGLAISKWKSMEKWPQSEVEEMLDYFASIGVITERQNGIACQWVSNFSIGQIARRMEMKSPPGNLTALP